MKSIWTVGQVGSVVAVTITLVVAVAWILQAGKIELAGVRSFSPHRSTALTDASRLVSVTPLPEMNGQMCEWMPASAPVNLTLRQSQPGAASSPSGDATAAVAEAAKRPPIRVIRDSYPAFSSVAVDVQHDEVVLTDENLFQILVYDRLSNAPPTANFSEPKRMIGGSRTKIEFQCGIYIDPQSGDIYAVNNDTVDTLVIFTREQRGNTEPAEELRTPHGTFGVAVSEQRQELFLSLQHTNAVVVFDKNARDRETPLRLMQGDKTRLADPHGLAVDTTRGLIYVTNHGSFREFNRTTGDITQTGMYQGTFSSASTWPAERRIPGTGKTFPSSISVHAIDAEGNTPPLRLISGPKTQLNWATGLSVDEETGELYVANDMGDSVLVFSPDAEGDAAPQRVLQGPRTGLKNPTGITLDHKNGELWVANFGNHTATVYKMDASGDTLPLRTIRSGPVDEPALMIGNPGAVAYDTKREEILVPN